MLGHTLFGGFLFFINIRLYFFYTNTSCFITHDPGYTILVKTRASSILVYIMNQWYHI